MSNPFSTPNPPNPQKVAAAQGAADKATAIAQANLNNYDQITPEGSLKYTVTGTNSDGTPKYTATQTYSPEQQAIYQQNSANSLQAGQIAGNQLGRVNDVLSTPFQLGATPQQAGVNLNNNLGLNNNLQLNQTLGNKTDMGLNTQLGQNTQLGMSGNLGNQTNLGLNENLGLNSNLGQRTDLGMNGNLSYSGSPSLDDSAVADRINQLGASRLDPRFAREQQTLESDLANRGVVPGTEAYKRAMDQFGQTKNDAYNQLALEGQNQAFQEQATRRGMSTAETDNVFNAQNAAQQANQQFYNQANLQNFDAANSAQSQNANFANAARQGNFNAFNQNNQANFDASNAAIQGNANFANQANMQNQQFANDATKSNFDAYNAANAQNQNFANQNALSQAGFNNQAQLAQGQFNNQATQQMASFNNQAQSNNWNQQIQDQLLMRNQPINETTALMSGSQVSQPNYAATPQTGIANTDVAGLYQQQYAAQAAQQQAMLGGLASLGGSAAFALSDRRAKKDIRKVGALKDGIGLYTYKYKDKFGDGGLSHLGVMAQDVEKQIPDAVVDTDSGYKAVDYARVLEEVS